MAKNQADTLILYLKKSIMVVYTNKYYINNNNNIDIASKKLRQLMNSFHELISTDLRS